MRSSQNPGRHVCRGIQRNVAMHRSTRSLRVRRFSLRICRLLAFSVGDEILHAACGPSIGACNRVCRGSPGVPVVTWRREALESAGAHPAHPVVGARRHRPHVAARHCARGRTRDGRARLGGGGTVPPAGGLPPGGEAGFPGGDPALAPAPWGCGDPARGRRRAGNPAGILARPGPRPAGSRQVGAVGRPVGRARQGRARPRAPARAAGGAVLHAHARATSGGAPRRRHQPLAVGGGRPPGAVRRGSRWPLPARRRGGGP